VNDLLRCRNRISGITVISPSRCSFRKSLTG
jgi:hypothetical protein